MSCQLYVTCLSVCNNSICLLYKWPSVYFTSFCCVFIFIYYLFIFIYLFIHYIYLLFYFLYLYLYLYIFGLSLLLFFYLSPPPRFHVLNFTLFPHVFHFLFAYSFNFQAFLLFCSRNSLHFIMFTCFYLT